MKNDLISKNKLLENMENWAFQECPIGVCDSESDVYKTIKEAIDAIKEQPVAYDVDKVIKELNRNFDITNWDKPYGITLEKAIEIVKSGGTK